MFCLNNKKIMRVLALLSVFICEDLYAGNMGDTPIGSSMHYFVSLSAGALWANVGHDERFYLLPDTEKAYLSSNNSKASFNGGFFAGKVYSFFDGYQTLLGLALDLSSSIDINGDVLEDADPTLNNFFYRYKVQSTRLSLKGKILKQTPSSFMPYISAGLGVAFNSAHGFTETPKIFEEIAAPPFQNHSKSTFTYALGVGVQKVLNTHWQAGVGYEFSDFGKANLARAQGQTLNSGLSLNHINSHSALVHLTYLA